MTPTGTKIHLKIRKNPSLDLTDPFIMLPSVSKSTQGPQDAKVKQPSMPNHRFAYQRCQDPLATMPSICNPEAMGNDRGPAAEGVAHKISIQKCWVYVSSQKKVVKRLGVLTMPAPKYCILRGSFSEMFDSLAIITSFGGLRTRALTHARNNRL